MAVGFGMPTDAQGNGTSPEDIQAITAAEYGYAGIISGCDVTGTSGMQWKISAGAVVIVLSPGHAVRVPVLAQTLNSKPAPPTGARTEYIYVKQNTPAADGSISAVVEIGERVPANAVMISKREIRAGMSATSAAPEAGDPVYARPVNTSGGMLHYAYYEDSRPHQYGSITWGTGEFTVETDRWVSIQHTSTVSSAKPGGTNHSTSAATPTDIGSVVYEFYIDGQHAFSRERRFDNVFESNTITKLWPLPRGRHRIEVITRHRWGFAWWMIRGGGANRLAGDQLVVLDVGVNRDGENT